MAPAGGRFWGKKLHKKETTPPRLFFPVIRVVGRLQFVMLAVLTRKPRPAFENRQVQTVGIMLAQNVSGKSCHAGDLRGHRRIHEDSSLTLCS
jgi:hypothetical protein